jgi:hypothetical protein
VKPLARPAVCSSRHCSLFFPLFRTPSEAGVHNRILRGEIVRISSRFRSFRTLLPSTLLILLLAGAPVLMAQDLKPIQLPRPQIAAGMPLMQALSLRRTTRAFRDQPLPMQTLSNLLWAAFGVNRLRDVKPGLGRTAPSAMNSQDIEIDVVLPGGVYVYEAEANRLRPVVAGDLRAKMGAPPAGQAAVTLVYVAPVKDDWA